MEQKFIRLGLGRGQLVGKLKQHIDENLGAMDFELKDEDVERK